MDVEHLIAVYYVHHCMSVQEGNTPLVLASELGYEEIVTLLIEFKADVNAQDKVLALLSVCYCPDILYTLHNKYPYPILIFMG